MNKFLFLDIDGVLNGYDIFQSKRPYPLSEFNEEKVEILNSLFNDLPDIKLVLSSSWRFTNGIENILNEAGIKVPLHSKIPYCLSSRGKEIKEFLKKVTSDYVYCIIDDIDDFDDDQKQNLILTNPNVGITKENVEKIKLILNG